MPNTINMTTVMAAAQDAYVANVTRDLTKKMTVIAKRTSQIDAYKAELAKALDAHVAAFTKKTTEFTNEVTAATTPAQISAILEAYQFPAKSIHFFAPSLTPSQAD